MTTINIDRMTLPITAIDTIYDKSDLTNQVALTKRKGRYMNDIMIRNRTGNYMNIMTLRHCDVDIDEIAWTLAGIARYGARPRKFLSVAQHCIHVSHLVPERFALAGLMHDAEEWVIGDIVSPICRSFEDLDILKDSVRRRIMQILCIPWTKEVQDVVHTADQYAAILEQDYIFKLDADSTVNREADYTRFLSRYKELRVSS